MMPRDTQNLPLCVDLDGSLLRTDLLYESLLRLLKRNIFYLFLLPAWLGRGRAYLKQRIAEKTSLDIGLLPYHHPLLTFLRAEHKRGRTLYLVTAADQKHARQVAEHLGIFQEVLASDGRINLKGEHKARLLATRFGDGGFVYVGDSRHDLPIWRRAAGAIGVHLSRGQRRELAEKFNLIKEFPRESAWWHHLPRALRLHQWLKNVLIFLPLVASHQIFEFALLGQAILGFLAFSLAASSTYIVNDLLDLDADRPHPHKRRRPFAAGRLSLVFGLRLAAFCLLAGLLLGLLLPPFFLAVLVVYYLLTLFYSFKLKQVVMVDVVCLAVLYTLRVIGGVGIQQEEALSHWLLAFSIFLFFSLAVAKRYIELLALRRKREEAIKGRGYLAGDLELLSSLGVSSGFLSVLVLALYINSETVRALYRHPDWLWLVCLLLLYWVSRLWLLCHRGQVHDDPVLFVIRDRGSHFVLLLGLALVLLAIP